MNSLDTSEIRISPDPMDPDSVTVLALHRVHMGKFRVNIEVALTDCGGVDAVANEAWERARAIALRVLEMEAATEGDQ